MEIHYVYKITNTLNDKIYIGVRTSPNPENDTYMGSSKIMESLYNIEGRHKFIKEIIQTFSTRREAEQYESSLLTEEFCNNPNTYNIHNTGGYSDGKHGFRKDLWYDYYDELRQKYADGSTTYELGEYYSCDNGTIRNIVNDIRRTNSEAQQLRFQKITTSGARNTDMDNNTDDIIDLYVNQHKSANYIAKQYNVHSDTIKRRLRENNIVLRSHSESQKHRGEFGRTKHSAWEHKLSILDLYNSGKTINELSKIYNCDNGTIKNILK
jgi:DNA invertase Pin-like site-specific DNA recombinase